MWLNKLVEYSIITKEEKPQVEKKYKEIREKFDADETYKIMKQYQVPQMQDMWSKIGLSTPEIGFSLALAVFLVRLQHALDYMSSQPMPQVFFPIIDVSGKKCASCGRLNVLGADYCVKCGKSLKT